MSGPTFTKQQLEGMMQDPSLDVRSLACFSDKLLERAENAEAERDVEKEIVDRIWSILGSPTYEGLSGRSIYDVIQEIMAERDQARRELEEAEEVIRITAHDDGYECYRENPLNTFGYAIPGNGTWTPLPKNLNPAVRRARERAGVAP